MTRKKHVPSASSIGRRIARDIERITRSAIGQGLGEEDARMIAVACTERGKREFDPEFPLIRDREGFFVKTSQ